MPTTDASQTSREAGVGRFSGADRLLQQRDTVCMRVLSIVSALLRWSNSDLRKVGKRGLRGLVGEVEMFVFLTWIIEIQHITSILNWKFLKPEASVQ